MRSIIRKPIVIFFIAFFILAAIFFLVPVNLFDAEYTFNENGAIRVVKTKMALSYFIGIGADEQQMKNVVSFRLLPMGYFLVFLFQVALPALIAYRIHLANQKDAIAG